MLFLRERFVRAAAVGSPSALSLTKHQYLVPGIYHSLFQVVCSRLMGFARNMAFFLAFVSCRGKVRETNRQTKDNREIRRGERIERNNRDGKREDR